MAISVMGRYTITQALADRYRVEICIRAAEPVGIEQIVGDSPGEFSYFEFYRAPAETKIVFKVTKDVCSDFTDTIA